MTKKRSSGSKQEEPIVNSSTSGGAVFSADTLSKLTQRIQIGFDKAKTPEKANSRNPRGRSNAVGREGKRKEHIDKAKLTGKGSKGARGVNRDHPKNQEGKPIEAANAPRGIKRARGAGRLRPEHAAPLESTPARPRNTKDGLPRKKKGGIDREALLREIIELGGTQEDLDLVAGIDSDSDEEMVFPETGKAGKGVQKELKGFMKEIGLEVGKYKDTVFIGDGGSDVSDAGEGEAGSGREEDILDAGDHNDSETEGEEEAPTAATTLGALKPYPKCKGSKLTIPPRPDWHAYELPHLTPPPAPPPAAIQALHTRAKTLLEAENSLYSATHLTKSSDRRFLSAIMTSGTLTDKISALTLICQESPLHTMKTLEALLGLARKKSRSQAVSSMGAIKDLFGPGTLLPPDRKLKLFSKQPGLGAKGCTDQHLIVWAYEDWLKGLYFQVLSTLEALCLDQLPYARTNAVGYVWELLKEKPEQEANLLRLLVNKLGDTDKKVASKVSHLLLQLQSSHPGMRSIIINSIESEVVFRPGNSLHAKYYAIITLNQTILSSRESYEVANNLLNLYFSIFTSLLQSNHVTTTPLGSSAPEFAGGKPPPKDKMNRKARARAEAEEKGKQFQEETNAKLISAVLTGVNRAFPFSQVDDDVFDKHMDTLFRITHSGNFNTSIQALMLIFQVSNSKQAVSDRFYRTLYESLFDQRLVSSSKQAMYLNLLFKALKADSQIRRVKAFVKRIVQVATFHQPPFVCGVLYLLSELEGSVPPIRRLMESPEELEEEEEVFRDVPEDRVQEQDQKQDEDPPRTRVEYDGRKRDPLYSNADRSCLWELIPFLRCYHPSVTLFATNLLQKKPIPSKPDLGMHSLTHFLDRFVYRNAKSAPSQIRGDSIMQPLAASDTKGMVISTRGGGKAQAPVNSEAFWKRKVEDVEVDEVFFHKYFNQIAPKKRTTNMKNAGKDAGEVEEEGGDEDEGEIWKALVESRPELEADDADFDDDGMEGGEDDEGSEDNEGSEDDEDSEGDEVGEEDEMEVSGGKSEDDTEVTPGVDDARMDDSDDGTPQFDEGEDDIWSTDDEEATSGPQKVFETESEMAVGKGKNTAREETEDEGDKRKKRRKLKHLPTFASVEDYAHLLSD